MNANPALLVSICEKIPKIDPEWNKIVYSLRKEDITLDELDQRMPQACLENIVWQARSSLKRDLRRRVRFTEIPSWTNTKNYRFRNINGILVAEDKKTGDTHSSYNLIVHTGPYPVIFDIRLGKAYRGKKPHLRDAGTKFAGLPDIIKRKSQPILEYAQKRRPNLNQVDYVLVVPKDKNIRPSPAITTLFKYTRREYQKILRDIKKVY